MSQNIPVVLEKRLTGDTKGPEKTITVTPEGKMVEGKAQTTDAYGTVLEKKQTLPSTATQPRGESGTVREDFA